MNYYNGIPDTDIMGNRLEIGDKVVVFNHHFISWDNCTIVEKDYSSFSGSEEKDMRRAIEFSNGGCFFGLGSHEILKESKS